MCTPLTKLLETRPNYGDWFYNLRIVLNLEHLSYVLVADIPPAPTEMASEEEKITHNKWVEDNW